MSRVKKNRRSCKKAEMSWAVIVGAVLAVTVIFLLIYLVVKSGRAGGSVLDCQEGASMCKQRASECPDGYTHTFKTCKIDDDTNGRCCAPSQI